MADQSVREKLEAKAYSVSWEYPQGPRKSNREAFAAYAAEQRRLDAQFTMDAVAEVGLKDHPKAAQIFEKAWSSHHAYGYLEVFQELEELAELFR